MDSSTLLVAGTFFGVLLIVLGPYFLFVVRTEVATEDILRRRIRTGGAAIRTAQIGLLKRVERMSVLGPLDRALAGDGRVAVYLRELIEMSGLHVTPAQMVLATAGTGAATWLLFYLWFGGLGVGLLFGLVGASIPYLILRIMHSRRMGKFEEQFPEAVDLIARTLRAGHAFPAGLRMAAEELTEPVASEFQTLYDQQNYGLPMPDALRAFARRVPLVDARFFVTAVLTQRESGGNLAEVLDNLSTVIRERFKIKRQLRVSSAHGRMTGFVLSGLPPALAAYMLVAKPENFVIMLQDPLGLRMIGVAVGLQCLGAFLIYKITSIDY